MTPLESQFLGAAETHDPAAIREALAAGLDVQARIDGRTPVQWMHEMYYRSDAFPECLRLLLDAGGTLEDPKLEPVLLNDADALRNALRADPTLVHHRTSLVSTFTPLEDATLLHVAAEYGNVDAARVLIEAGAEVNARAGVDEHGLNGHTPLFHTVNSNRNRSEPLMRLLLEAGAKPDLLLPGIVWGKSFEWETTVFDVTPISYAQMGLLPQFQRTEKDIDHNIRLLLRACGRPVPPLPNIPNRYLYPKAKRG